MIRLNRALLGAIAIAIAVVPAVSGAHDGHCNDLFVLSGVDTGDGNRQGSNPGAVSCQVDNGAYNDSPAHIDTNYTVPGSTHLWAAAFDDFAKPTGTYRIGNGNSKALTFSLNDLRGRWESQSVDLSGVEVGTVISFSVVLDGKTVKNAYTRI